MTKNELIELVQRVVAGARDLKNRHMDQHNAPVNYACLFAQTEKQYQAFSDSVKAVGRVVQETHSGFLYEVSIPTDAGLLRILKIRKPDVTKPELGDADFTVDDYPAFKVKYLDGKGFKLITRSDMEMIELMEDACDVRAYFSNPPVDKELLG